MTDNCVSMYENAPPNKLGEWEDHDCATPLAYICKGPVSDKVSVHALTQTRILGRKLFPLFYNIV